MKEKTTSHDNASMGTGSVVNEAQFVYNDFHEIVTDYQEHGAAVNAGASDDSAEQTLDVIHRCRKIVGVAEQPEEWGGLRRPECPGASGVCPGERIRPPSHAESRARSPSLSSRISRG
jgi:hypothetical protein